LIHPYCTSCDVIYNYLYHTRPTTEPTPTHQTNKARENGYGSQSSQWGDSGQRFGKELVAGYTASLTYAHTFLLNGNTKAVKKKYLDKYEISII